MAVFFSFLRNFSLGLFDHKFILSKVHVSHTKIKKLDWAGVGREETLVATSRFRHREALQLDCFLIKFRIGNVPIAALEIPKVHFEEANFAKSFTPAKLC